jgi:uncharacterized membrane protein
VLERRSLASIDYYQQTLERALFVGASLAFAVLSRRWLIQSLAAIASAAVRRSCRRRAW